MEKIINGKEISNKLKEELKQKLKEIKGKPKFIVIQVGNNPASDVYVRNKEKVCKEIGIDAEILKYGEISEKDLINKIKELNDDKLVNSILVQLPLPSEINETNVIEAINPIKDVDGLTSANLGKLFSKQDAIVPCTALGVLKLLEEKEIDLEGKKVTILGRSKLVGLPLVALLLNKNATVTICHSKTKNIEEETKTADILIVAIGKKEYVKKEMIKPGAILIDVGINRDNNKLYGDIDYNDCYDKCQMITPVPGGVGPMTIMMLMNNIIASYLDKQ